MSMRIKSAWPIAETTKRGTRSIQRVGNRASWVRTFIYLECHVSNAINATGKNKTHAIQRLHSNALSIRTFICNAICLKCHLDALCNDGNAREEANVPYDLFKASLAKK